jgi:hypothetical protein
MQGVAQVSNLCPDVPQVENLRYSGQSRCVPQVENLRYTSE